MPVRKSGGGYKYGDSGKIYRAKAKAQKQGAAIRASQHSKGKR